MKNLLIGIALCLLTISGFSKDINGIKITKEIICKGAAVSVVGNVKPFF